MENKRLLKKIFIKGYMEALTGIHIGGTNSAMSIGGVDKSVVRNPVTNLPYIPGSSLKGKMRALTELMDGTIEENRGTFGPTTDLKSLSGRLFGTASKDKEQQQPSRLLVRDGVLVNGDEITGTDLPYTESKTEVSIDRITSAANPRQFERVPAGARFKLELVLNVFSGEKEEELLKGTLRALNLVQDDYVGGQGSRGYGQIRIGIQSMTERSNGYYTGKDEETPSAYPIPERLKG